MKTKISWREKVNKIEHIELVNIPPKMQGRFGKGKMLIPRPVDIEKHVSGIRKGSLMTKSQLREILAEEAGADVTCPLTAGIFLRIVSEAAEEDLSRGKKKIVPYWRVVGEKGELNDKFPGGAEAQAEKLEAEGLKITAKSRSGKLVVSDFEDRLVKV